MADTDFVAGALQKIREGTVRFSRPVSEALGQLLAGNINQTIDELSSIDNVVNYSGDINWSTQTDASIPIDKVGANDNVDIQRDDGKPLEGSYDTVFTKTFSSVPSGKTILMDFSTSINTASGADLRVRIDTTQEEEWTSIVTAASGIHRTVRFSYTVPSAGNYTIDIQHRDCALEWASWMVQVI